MRTIVCDGGPDYFQMLGDSQVDDKWSGLSHLYLQHPGVKCFQFLIDRHNTRTDRRSRIESILINGLATTTGAHPSPKISPPLNSLDFMTP